MPKDFGRREFIKGTGVLGLMSLTGGIRFTDLAGTAGNSLLTVQTFPDRHGYSMKTRHVGVGLQGRNAADVLAKYQRRNRKGDPGLTSSIYNDPRQLTGTSSLDDSMLLFLSGSLTDPHLLETREYMLGGEPYLLWTLAVGSNGGEMKPREDEIVVLFDGDDVFHQLCSFILHMDSVLTYPGYFGNDLSDWKVMSGRFSRYHHFSLESHVGFGGLDQFLSQNRKLLAEAKTVTCILTNADPDFPLSELNRVLELVHEAIGPETSLLASYDSYTLIGAEPGVMLLII